MFSLLFLSFFFFATSQWRWSILGSHLNDKFTWNMSSPEHLPQFRKVHRLRHWSPQAECLTDSRRILTWSNNVGTSIGCNTTCLATIYIYSLSHHCRHGSMRKKSYRIRHRRISPTIRSSSRSILSIFYLLPLLRTLSTSRYTRFRSPTVSRSWAFR